MYKNRLDGIVCPYCGEYGVMQKFQSNVTKEVIYRCDECFGICESLSDLNNNIMVFEDSRYANFIGINNFDTDALLLGTLTEKDFEQFQFNIKSYPDNGIITMYNKSYDNDEITLEKGETTWNAKDN